MNPKHIMAQNGGKKPEVPPKPIITLNNLGYREKTPTKSGHDSGHLEICESTDDKNKQSFKGSLHPSIKHSSFCRDKQRHFQMKVVTYREEASLKALPKPPLLPKPSPQVYRNTPVNFTSEKGKSSLNVSSTVRPFSFTVTNVGEEFNDKNDTDFVTKARKILESGSTVVEKCCNVSLEDKCHRQYFRSDHVLEHVSSEKSETAADSSSYQRAFSFFRHESFDDKFNKKISTDYAVTSLPNLCTKDKCLFINMSNAVLLKQYPCVNAICDTFYPADLHSICVKSVGVTSEAKTKSSHIASLVSKDSVKDDLSSCNARFSRKLIRGSSVLAYNVKCLAKPFQDVKTSSDKDYSECSVKSKSVSLMCSSHNVKNVSSNLKDIVPEHFSRRYSLPSGYKSYLHDEPQTHRGTCSKSLWCFECADEHRSSKCRDIKISKVDVKVKPSKISKSSSTFYLQHDLSNREATRVSDISSEISELEGKCSNSHKLITALDVNRPASGLSGMFESDENSDAPSSESYLNVQDISDSDNEESITSINQPVTLTDAERQEKKAFYTVRELVTSEKVFLDVLRLLTQDLKNAVKFSERTIKSIIIPEENFSKILNNLPQLLHLNEDLLNDLEYRVDNWNTIKKVSDVIVKKGPFLKLYSTYIQNFEFQCNYLDECCCKYPKFARVVKEFEASPRCKKLSLKHYMIKPVQRIPQYRLILSDYLSTQNCDSPDYEDTKAALKIVCDVADHANRGLKLGLNDCLLCTSYIGSTIHSAESVKVNYQLPLDNLKVSVPKTQAYENEFSIISTQRSFRLSARSSEERDEWVSVLKDAIREYEKRKESFKRKPYVAFKPDEEVSFPAFSLGKDAPVWVHDFRVTRCQSCTEPFTVTFRRHHCRACGKVVCGNCSENRAPLEYKKYQSARVCGDCFESLLREFEETPPQLGSDESDTIRARFVKKGETGKKKYVPERLLEVTANDAKSQISGWLQKRSRRSWKRYWFVLKNQVLYVYKASEDVVALESIPVLGYQVVSLKEASASLYEGIDKNLVFQLHHIGQTPITFYADSEQMTAKWIAALEAQTVF
ncbi:FYVE, RhoGEF and PH domain-containing protein 6-like isoform X2 [Bacillus rossius redtenbacheri]|uniref:FYVE, RhoGEF and PH domain-containing protein 6-like isoform X2 n=1 Tax=Bacillus rossius redtenbacheri TaxID=93214 RepID=UPI002FDCEC3F